jgi:hypothetical protein
MHGPLMGMELPSVPFAGLKSPLVNGEMMWFSRVPCTCRPQARHGTARHGMSTHYIGNAAIDIHHRSIDSIERFKSWTSSGGPAQCGLTS